MSALITIVLVVGIVAGAILEAGRRLARDIAVVLARPADTMRGWPCEGDGAHGLAGPSTGRGRQRGDTSAVTGAAVAVSPVSPSLPAEPSDPAYCRCGAHVEGTPCYLLGVEWLALIQGHGVARAAECFPRGLPPIVREEWTP
jgi:hypothetical protein